jgi:hypothetical protein
MVDAKSWAQEGRGVTADGGRFPLLGAGEGWGIGERVAA